MAVVVVWEVPCSFTAPSVPLRQGCSSSASFSAGSSASGRDLDWQEILGTGA